MQRHFLTRRGFIGSGLLFAAASRAEGLLDGLLSDSHGQSERVYLPDPLVAEAYEKAAVLNILAAVDPKIFPGYFAVTTDTSDHFYGSTFPTIDGPQMVDALLWLGKIDVVKASWDFVRSFQRRDGQLPLGIIPSLAGRHIGPPGMEAPVDSNGGWYVHFIPGHPLAAAASPSYIQTADMIFRYTLDHTWLKAQIASINLAADYLASLVDNAGAVRGSAYYVERPVRLGCDGVTQPFAMDAFQRTASLNRVLGHDEESTRRYEHLAERIRANFIENFWMKDHFVEYVHPTRGPIDIHGLSDTNWAALAFGALTAEQEAVLWPQLKNERRFYYGGMPTGIVTEPEKYQDWEFTWPDRMDVASMGRVWYLESQARARMGDAEGLLESIRLVANVGRENGYYWRERYNSQGGYGAKKYTEYPANLIRIVQRFLFGVDLRLDGTLALAPMVTADFWDRGFGQKLTWRDRVLDYRMRRGQITGTYVGGVQPISVQLEPPGRAVEAVVLLNGKRGDGERRGDMIQVTLPMASIERPCEFEVRCVV